jgi:hypothetical protein
MNAATIFFGVLAFVSMASTAVANPCVVLDRGGQAVQQPNFDPLYRLLTAAPDCPGDVFAFRDLLSAQGLAFKTSLVGNRGFHNPGLGSFSLFEMVEGKASTAGFSLKKGEFFFGHFTGVSDTDPALLVADQSPRNGSLMIELIIWDDVKQLFNFYELRGSGTTGTWFYQGDSADIINDMQWVYRDRPANQPVFGNLMRCSGCHTHGGPIMKEISEPHNDWWRSNRALPLGGRKADGRLAPLMQNLTDAAVLADAVNEGMTKLRASPSYRAALAGASLQERLRPLFMPVELALAAGNAHSGEPFFNIPGGFFIDPRLVADADVAIARANYEAALTATQSSFPETQRADADHPWLTPVKSPSDIAAVEALLEERFIDRRFMRAVLAVDFTNPLFSPIREGLLKLLPATAYRGWKDDYIATLRTSVLPGARELYDYLTNPQMDDALILRRSRDCVAAVRHKANNHKDVAAYYQVLMQRRREVAAAEISHNPRGQILEPGFRVIFPESPSAPQPGQWAITPGGDVQPRALLSETCRRGLGG